MFSRDEKIKTTVKLVQSLTVQNRTREVNRIGIIVIENCNLKFSGLRIFRVCIDDSIEKEVFFSRFFFRMKGF